MRHTATPHTPGPWRAVKFKDTKSWSLYANAGSLGNIRDEVDARLAAASPELLAALKALLIQALQSDVNKPENEWGREALELTRAAIAKAEGAK